MNVKEKILELNRLDGGDECEIENLLMVIMTKFQLMEPCRYLSENDEWINISMISMDDEKVTQPMSVKKSEVTMVGIFNRDAVELNPAKTDSEVFYQ